MIRAAVVAATAGLLATSLAAGGFFWHRDQQAERALVASRSLAAAEGRRAHVLLGELGEAHLQLDDAKARVVTLQAETQQLAGRQNELAAQLASRGYDGNWLGQWNVSLHEKAGAVQLQVVPDTFDMDVSFRSTASIGLYFISLNDYLRLWPRGCLPECIPSGMPSYAPTTTLSHARFTLAEGCAGYLAVFTWTGDGWIFPDQRVRYNPAPHATGECARG